MGKQQLQLEGILGFPVTPFERNGSVAWKALEANVSFLVQSGLDAVFICAGSGEFQSLHREEYSRIVEMAVATVHGKIPVYAGVGGNIQYAIELAEIAADKGAEGLLILPPYLIYPEQEGLYRYYHTIAGHTSLASILYQRDNAVFSVETVERLCELPQVVGFKDGHGNMELNVELTRTVGSRLGWMNGMPFAEVTMPAYMPLGFHTYSSALSNYLPHISRLFYQALQRQDQPVIDALYRECILPINQIRKQRKGYAVSLIKAGMEIVGLPVGASVRAPLVEVEKEHYKQLEAIVNRVMQIYPKSES